MSFAVGFGFCFTGGASLKAEDFTGIVKGAL